MTEGANGFDPVRGCSNEQDEGIDLTNFSKEEEIKKFADFSPQGWNVAVRLYIKPSKVGSIIMTNKMHEDQQYQTCVGLVVRKAKAAYDDPRYDRTGSWCQLGDWVVFPRHAGYMIHHKGLPVFVLKEDAIDVIVDDPSTITR